MSLDELPVRVLQNAGGESLRFLQHLFGQGQEVRVASGYIWESGLVALGPRFEELVMQGRVTLLGGAGPTQITKQAIRWFEARRRAEHLKRVDPRLGFLHAKVWLIDSPGVPFLWSLVGSSNITEPGLVRSRELNVWFPSPAGSPTAVTLKNFFSEMYENSEPASWHVDSYKDEHDLQWDDLGPPESAPSAVPKTPQPAPSRSRAPSAPEVQAAPTPPSVAWNASPNRPAPGPLGTPDVRGTPVVPPVYSYPSGRVGDGSRSGGSSSGETRAQPGDRSCPSNSSEPRPTGSESASRSSQADEAHRFDAGPTPWPLEDFQREAIAAIRDGVRAAARLNVPFAGVLNLPTGGGKTKVAAWWLLEDYIAKGGTILWVAHRSELLDQAEEAFAEHRQLLAASRQTLKIGRLDGASKDLPEGVNVILASTQTLVNAPTLVKHYGAGLMVDCVCYDEAHHALADETSKMLKKLRRWSEHEVPLLGLTATPFRSNMGKTTFLEGLFDAAIVYSKSFGELVQRGFLAEPVWRRLERDAYSRRVRLTADDIAMIQRQHEFTPDVLERVAHDDDWNRAIIAKWASERATFGQAVLFACNIDHCSRLARIAANAGIDARVLTHLVSKEDRRALISAFKQGAYQLLINVQTLTEGTDLPDVQSVIMARPTLSGVLHTQMLGRGARRGRDRRKERFYVLDCVHNCLFHDVGGLQMPGESDWRT